MSLTPAVIIKSRTGPAGHFFARIISFTLAIIVILNWARGSFKAFVTYHLHSFTVGQLDIHLQKQNRPVPIRLASGGRWRDVLLGTKPAVTQHHAQGIFAFFQLIRHIVGNVKRTRVEIKFLVMVVVGRAGVEYAVADFAAIDIQFVVSQAADMDRCPFDLLVKFKCLAQQRRRDILVGADPFTLPVAFFKQAHLKRCRLTIVSDKLLSHRFKSRHINKCRYRVLPPIARLIPATYLPEAFLAT